MEYSKYTQIIVFLLAAMPYSLTVYMIFEHFNWKTPRNKRLCDMLLKTQIGLTILQCMFLVLLVGYIIYFRNDIF